MGSETDHGAGGGTGEERRVNPRTTTRFDARLAHSGQVFDGVVVDIAFGGAKFVTKTVKPVLPITAAVVLTIVPNGGTVLQPLTWEGMVLRTERSGDGGPDRISYAIEFDELAPRWTPPVETPDFAG